MKILLCFFCLCLALGVVLASPPTKPLPAPPKPTVAPAKPKVDVAALRAKQRVPLPAVARALDWEAVEMHRDGSARVEVLIGTDSHGSTRVLQVDAACSKVTEGATLVYTPKGDDELCKWLKDAQAALPATMKRVAASGKVN